MRNREFTRDLQDQFESQGFLKLGAVGTIGDIDDMCARIEDIMLGRVRYDEMVMQLDPAKFPDATASVGFKGATLDYRRVQDLEVDPVFRSYLTQPFFEDVTTRLLGPDVGLFRATYMTKTPGGEPKLSWHQDGASWDQPDSEWRTTIEQKLTVWTGLDASTVENGAIQVVPGSHRVRRGSSDFLTEEEIKRFVDPAKVEYIEVGRGEVFILHPYTLHWADVNRTDRPRRALSVCYLPARARQPGTGKDFPQVFPEYRPAVDKAFAEVDY